MATQGAEHQKCRVLWISIMRTKYLGWQPPNISTIWISISAEEQATFCKKENEKIKVDIEIQKQKTGCKNGISFLCIECWPLIQISCAVKDWTCRIRKKIKVVRFLFQVREGLLYYLWWTRARAMKIWTPCIQAYMPHESSGDSSNQPIGHMGSPRRLP